jgi:hypothetical protein
MGYSVTQPMFWLQNHNEHKKGEPIGKLALIAVARVKMLCAQGIVGTEEDLKAAVSKEVEVKVEAPLISPVEVVEEDKEPVVLSVKKEERHDKKKGK